MSTTTTINFATIAALSGDNSKGVSLCIPRVFNNISWRRIKRIFIALNWGYVERVDVVPSGGTKRAFIHFAPNKFNAKHILEPLCEGKQVKIVYDEPWYWNISLSRSAKPAEAPKPRKQFEVEVKVAPRLKRQDFKPMPKKALGGSVSSVGAASLAAGVELSEKVEYDRSLQPDEEMRGSNED